MTYTKREIDIFLQGMRHARSQAIQTGKGIVASNAITREIQTVGLRRDICVNKGVL